MADSQGVPVFLRDVDDGERQFLGRFPIGDLDAVVASIAEHGFYNGQEYRNGQATQWIAGLGPSNGTTGFEIILDSRAR